MSTFRDRIAEALRAVRNRAPLALLLFAGALAYSNVFRVPFLFDDVGNIVDNPIIRDFGYFLHPDRARGLPFYEALRLRYVGYLSFATNYAAGGLDVWGYHAFNVAVHLINAVLVYCLTSLSLRARGQTSGEAPYQQRIASVVAAALFVCHPVQTQAVTYVVQRLTSLATLFYLTAIVLYAKARFFRMDGGRLLTARGWSYYLLAIGAAFLSAKTKEIAFTLPAVIFIYELFFIDDRSRVRVLYVVPFLFAAALIPFALLQGTQSMSDLMGSLESTTRVQTDLSRLDYVATQSVVITTYLRLLFLPVGQNLDYDYPLYHSFLNGRVLASCSLLVALLLVAVLLIRRSKGPEGTPAALAAFGILWFFVTLMVESSVIPIVDVIFEHRLYLPSVGAFMALGAIFAATARRFRPRSAVLNTGASAALVAAVAVLAMATFARNRVWGDAVTFWEDVARKSPRKARVHNNLGRAYAEHARFEDAIRAYQQAIRLDTAFVDPYVNLGLAYSDRNRLDEAEHALREALALRPDDADAWNNLAVVWLKKGRLLEAWDALDRAVKARPAFAEAHNNLGTVHARLGQYDQALECFRKAAALRPNFAEVTANIRRAEQKRRAAQR